jgi:hypothetical protein
MPTSGWKRLLAGAPWFRGKGAYPIAAYSEFMPPPRLGRKPYDGYIDPTLYSPDDPFGWHISEYEEAFELRPGLETIAKQVLGKLAHLGAGDPAHGISRRKLVDNPYWPSDLANHAGKLPHERYVLLMPLALSRTQDDKGRVRWTLFGSSEQGPARGFWRSFFTAPDREQPEEPSLAFFRELLGAVYGEPANRLADLRAAGLRILPRGQETEFPYWTESPLPSWTTPYLWSDSTSISEVKYLLTFRPFGDLPVSARKAYLDGKLHLLPFPGSLVPWGARPYHHLQGDLLLAMQTPLLHWLARRTGWHDIRVPQSGWLHEPRLDQPEPDESHGPVRNTYKRNHRWSRVLRHEDELALVTHEEKLTHVLFSTMPDDLGLYGKPMARNVQLWDQNYHLLLDGPQASHDDIDRTIHAVRGGGLFGYRFQWPAMRVGLHEIYWHRPLVAYISAQSGQPVVVPDAPTGYLTAYRVNRPDLARPIELWPRFLRREPHLAGIQLFNQDEQGLHPRVTTLNIHKLLDTRRLLGDRLLPRSLARALLTCPKQGTIDGWLESLPHKANNTDRGQHLAAELRRGLEAEDQPPAVEGLTYRRTAKRFFEVAYWKAIAAMAEGKYINKNNADCIHDPITAMRLPHHRRDLEALGDYILSHYLRVIADAKMKGKALVGDLPFAWHTDFDFSWFGGWTRNQERDTHERDLIVVIPGRDRRRAVIMADHYDTAYMADTYEKQYGGDGARLAASGADDNHSATAALMLGAPAFLELSRQGKLACDIWLIHLTGEEFPADCLGARHLCQQLVQGTLRMRLPDGRWHSLAKTRVQGVYVLDMVAHNNDHERDIFQLSPGTSPQSMWLAYQAHLANEIWNASTARWNQGIGRRGRGRGQRSPDGSKVPDVAEHLPLHGEVRPPYDPRSTLYNTDGQIFSDAGVPVVLFMENYDINRTGYHDTHDTMDNIDLDYGAAVAAIAIEAVARAATEEPFPVRHS